MLPHLVYKGEIMLKEFLDTILEVCFVIGVWALMMVMWAWAQSHWFIYFMLGLLFVLLLVVIVILRWWL